ncbi:MAG: hypothetical protein Kow0098_10200 [Ignavibacteriaceae bacterium]
MTGLFKILVYLVVFLLIYIIYKSVKTYLYFLKTGSDSENKKYYRNGRKNGNIEDAEYTELESKIKSGEDKDRNGGK